MNDKDRREVAQMIRVAMTKAAMKQATAIEQTMQADIEALWRMGIKGDNK